VRADGAADVAGEQHGAEHGHGPDQVEDGAGCLENAQRDQHALGQTQMRDAFLHLGVVDELHGGAEQEQQRDQHREAPSHPHDLARGHVALLVS
jgi:hypothetical protein